MEGSTKLTKVDCDLFITAKDLLRRGYSRASVQRLLCIGEKTVRKIDRSETLSDYCRQVEAERVKKVARRNMLDAIRQIEEIMNESEYDRKEYANKPKVMIPEHAKIEGGSVIIYALLGILIIAIVVISWVMSAIFNAQYWNQI